MVRYQIILCENLCIQLEVVKILNPTTLLLVDSVPQEHVCLEVFSSWLNLNDQPVSH
jgi:hypothetical protein